VSFYPAFLDLRGRRAVVVGGGAVAEQKVAGLVEAGARVTVISPAVTWKLEDLAAQGTIALRRRGYRRGDLAGAFLAIAAAADRRVNRAVWREAEARGVLLNAVDDLPHCSFIAPAVHREGAITIAVSTAGKSPAFAARLRERIARLVGPEHAAFVELLGELRATVADRVPDARARTRLWYAIVDSAALDDVRRGDLAGARRRIARLIEEAAAATVSPAVPAATRPRGIVYLVGAGPGHPGLITVRGLELVRAADAVVYDRLVHPRLVEEAPAWAERIFVGKRPAGRSVAQERTNDLLIELARAGQVVVRLKGGDPFVFGRGAEECAALAAAGVPVEVVPGVTAAIAAPAAAGIPVTHRAHASAFAVAAGREAGAESDLDWEALARMPAVVFLMGLGALPAIAARLRAHGARGDTPAAVIARATLADQRVVIGTLDTIAASAREAGLAPPATVVVGDVVRVAAALGVPAAAAPAAGAAPATPAGAIPAEHDAVAVVV
jgi:uroporphyrin-III C-methyltransferase/precorrin-2 dehydrogenase/sirohydrochlorin ferrochelatase